MISLSKLPSSTVPVIKAERTARLLALDGARGIVAIAVVFHHIFWAIRGPNLVAHGQLAVDFFMVLSGFVVARAYGARIRSRSLSGVAYLITRAIRLYPLIWLGTILGLATASVTGLPSLTAGILQALSGLATMPYFGSADGPLFPLDPPTWSLFFEVIASVAFVLLARTHLVWTMIGTGALGFAYVAYLIHSGNTDAGLTIHSFAGGFVRTGFAFGTGVILERAQGRLQVVPSVPTGAMGLALILLLCFPSLSGKSEIAFRIVASMIVVPALVFLGGAALPLHKNEQ